MTGWSCEACTPCSQNYIFGGNAGEEAGWLGAGNNAAGQAEDEFGWDATAMGWELGTQFRAMRDDACWVHASQSLHCMERRGAVAWGLLAPLPASRRSPALHILLAIQTHGNSPPPSKKTHLMSTRQQLYVAHRSNESCTPVRIWRLPSSSHP
jgi:hypothetical protein